MRLATLVPAELKSHLSSALTKGYNFSNRLFDKTLVLDNAMGRQARPHIRKAAIEYFAQRNLGRVAGLEAIQMKNSIGNHTYLELHYNPLSITFSHLAKINGEKQTLPRDCNFRKTLAANNPLQMSLWGEPKETESGLLTNIHAMVLHEGNEFPESAWLAVADLDRRIVLDSIPIPLLSMIGAEAEKVEDLEIEFNALEDELRKDGRA